MASGGTYPAVADLANQVRHCYRSDPLRAESLVEDCLERCLEGVPLAARLSLIEELLHLFEPSPPGSPDTIPSGESTDLEDFFSLLLGQRVASGDLGSKDLAQRLAASLNSIFDQLNELVGIINRTFGKETAVLETIRHLIGSDLGRPTSSDSLASYIGQIKEAFLIANQAARQAAAAEVGKILAELDPERLADDTEKGLRFGFRRKGELIEAYRDKYLQIRKWFEADHFFEDYARELERACHELHSEKGRGR